MAGDTIFALSSAPGRAGIAVVRVSGPGAGAAIEALTAGPLPAPRRAALRDIFPPATRGRKIDQGLVLWFPAPGSATGEDVAELHVHGGRAIVEAVLSALSSLPGLRPAERGEFTRRAVENGKLDLTQAEGLADLVEAETEAQRRQALAQYQGDFLRACEDWRARLIRLCAWAEADIDFAEDELDADLASRLRAETAALLADIRGRLADGRRGEITREGFHLAVIGPPNAGKSSLVNALARRDIAIVSETPGTTRDVLEARLDIDGYMVTVADTAGLREAKDAIEAEGVRRALVRAEAADLVLLVLDGSSVDPLRELPRDVQTDRAIIVWNKSDSPWPVARDGLKISVRTGDGLEGLQSALSRRIRNALESDAREAPVITRLRHRRALEEAAEALSRALDQAAAELAAEDLRLALRAIGRITGRVDIEALLDVIFRDFCIGK